MKRVVLAGLLIATVTACGTTVAGAPTWPGATLDKVALTEADFPPGVLYDRVVESPDQPDGAGGPAAMLSKPPGCTDGDRGASVATSRSRLTKSADGSSPRSSRRRVRYSVAFRRASP